MRTNLKGVITDSKYMFDKKTGFCLYVDIKTDENKGFGVTFKSPEVIVKLLEKGGEKSWCWMDPDVLIGRDVRYDYDETKNTCALKIIRFITREDYEVTEHDK